MSILSIAAWGLSYYLLWSGNAATWHLQMDVTAQKHIDRGICQVCGYDLRATPTRCPECGTVPAESTS